jgi:hypothetical protein
MTPRPIEILLDRDELVFQPGEDLAGQFLVVPAEGMVPKAIELSVVWHTEGKGDEDLGVHYFERYDAQEQTDHLLRPIRFQTRLPASPLSYEGNILKIKWLVRVRVYPKRGEQLLADEPFRLGNVPPATDWTQ